MKNTTKNMTLSRFQEIVDSYGSNINRWPLAERDAARTFLDYEPKAQEITEKAKLIDAMFDRMATPEPASAAFLDQLIHISDQPQAQDQSVAYATAKSETAPSSPSGFFAAAIIQFLPRAVGLASVCVLGVVMGIASINTSHNNVVAYDDATSLMFSTSGIQADLEEMD